MHRESLNHMRAQVGAHIAHLTPGKVLEVGSKSRKAEYRRLWERKGWTYTGCDLGAGPNVDTVLADPFVFPWQEGTFDAVISGQMLEHNTMFWLTFLEMNRVLKMGGMMIHIAPSRGAEHRAPTDCWRFYRDGMAALADWSGFELVEARTDWSEDDISFVEGFRPRSARKLRDASANPASVWGDTVGVFRKTAHAHDSAGMRYIHDFAQRMPPKLREVSAA